MHGCAVSSPIGIAHLQNGLAAAVPFVAVTIPRLVPALLIVCGAAVLLGLLWRARDRLLAAARQPIAIALFALAAYMLVNSAWALDSDAARGKSMVFLALAASTVALAKGVGRLRETHGATAARIASYGLAAGLIVLVVELAFGQPLREAVLTWYPTLGDGFGKHIRIENGAIAYIPRYLLNRNVTVAVLLAWPAAMLCRAHGLPWVWTAILVALVGLCATLSDNQTALIALVLSGMTFGLALLSTKAVRLTVAAVWVAGVAFAVPLGALPHKYGWTEWTWLPPESATARFYIWSYTAEKAMERPLTGIGVRGTRTLQPAPPDRSANPPTVEDRYRPRPGRHAHNAFLQIWLELGAIGAALVLMLGLAALSAIGRLERNEAAFGYALFATICTVAAFGFGIWQTWLLGAICLSALVFLLGLRPARAPAAG